jgi:hypothetical protein
MRGIVAAAVVLWLPAFVNADHHDLSYYLDSDGARREIRSQEDWQIRRRQIMENLQQVMGPLPDESQRPQLDCAARSRTKVIRPTA